MVQGHRGKHHGADRGAEVALITNAPRAIRAFPCEIWHPECSKVCPLIVFSHSSGPVGRRQSTFLCAHLASHGYVVAAIDHSEKAAPKLVRQEGETPEQRAARIQGWIDSRVPDVRFLLDYLLDGSRDLPVKIDRTRIGLVGHSFGGWTVLAVPESDERVGAIVALAPAGSTNPPPNIIPAKLTFEWGRDVPTLYLVAEDDSALPLAGMHELFERTRATKRMVVLQRADHGHFADAFEESPRLTTRAHAHAFVRGLTLAHLDAVLRGREEARRFWRGDIAAVLRDRGIDALV